MKRLILATAAVMFVLAGANAQQTSIIKKLQGLRQSTAWYPVSQKATSNTMSKTTGSGQRLRWVTGREMGTLTDSVHFIWGGTRDLEHVNNPLSLAFSGDNVDPYQPQRPINIYSYNKRYITTKPDSAFFYYFEDGMPPELSQTISNVYDANDRVAINSVYQLPGNGQSTSDYYYYNTDGTISAMDNYIDTSMGQTGAFVLLRKMYCIYNSAGHLIKDSVMMNMFSPGSYSLTTYQPDANGLDTGITLGTGMAGSPVMFTSLRYSLKYTGSNVQRIAMYFDNTTGEELMNVDSFGYTGTQAYPTYYRSLYYNSGTGTIDMGTEELATLNSNGDVSSQLWKNYDNMTMTWDTTVRFEVFYNTYKNADSLIADIKESGVWMNDGYKFRYYYDTVASNPQNIAEVKEHVQIQVYPNPATSQLTVNVPHAQSGDMAQTMVFDAAGRLVQRAAFRGGKINLNTTSLPTGIYHLQYQSGNKKGTASFVKQ